MATAIINAAIFMATTTINAAIFLKKFFIFSSLSLFNTLVFFNCKNFVLNLICHFPTKTKKPAARITPKRQDFLTKKGITTANPSYVLRKCFFLISCIYYTRFSGRRKFLSDFFISSSFIAYINNESKCTACKFVLCFAYLYLIRFFVQKKDGFAVLLTFFVRQMEQKRNHSDNCSVCQNDNGSLN